ncbi:LAGLIDADG family homing endonuclease [Priestia aryabhattai]|uniref:LAGLIDADG family homing endonuclease n=1 Tax=Priestia aryabhattai TaxID=412384 RepID=UPI003D2B6D82
MVLEERLPLQTLYSLYHEQKLSLKKIADLYEVTTMSIYNLMVKYNIPRRGNSEKSVNPHPNSLELRISKSDLIQLHYKEEKRLYEIAQIYKTHSSTLVSLFKRYGLKPRSSGYYREIAKKLLSKETLFQWYYVNKWNTSEIADKIGCSSNTICILMDEYGFERRDKKEASGIRHARSVKINESFFLNDSADLFYILGLWATDGWISGNTIGISLKDKEVIEWIAEKIDLQLPIAVRKMNNPNHSTVYEVRFSSVLVKDIMALYCITERKTMNLKFPTNIPNQYLCDFVRGAFDGDGAISISKKRGQSFSIGGASKDFIEALAEQVNIYTTFNGKVEVSKMNRKNPYYTFRSSNLYRIKDIAYWMYGKNLDKFGMKRKKDKIIDLIEKEYVTRNQNLNFSFFDVENEAVAFILGVFASKMTVNRQKETVTLSCPSKEKLEEIGVVIGLRNKIYRGNGETYTLRTMSMELIKIFDRYDIISNPSSPNISPLFLNEYERGKNFLPRRYRTK